MVFDSCFLKISALVCKCQLYLKLMSLSCAFSDIGGFSVQVEVSCHTPGGFLPPWITNSLVSLSWCAQRLSYIPLFTLLFPFSPFYFYLPIIAKEIKKCLCWGRGNILNEKWCSTYNPVIMELEAEDTWGIKSEIGQLPLH